MSAIVAMLSWVSLSMGATLSAAVMPFMQMRFQAERLSMLFWLRVLMTVVALPVLIFTGLPDDPVFYVATLLTALIWSYADLASFRASEDFGAGAVTRLIPLNGLVTFVMWVGLKPHMLYQYLDHPVRGLGIFLSLCAAIYFATRLQKTTVTRAAMRAMAPVILVSGMGVIFAKVAIDTGDSHSSVFAYIAFQSLLMAGIFWLLEAKWQPVPRAVFAGRAAMTAGFVMGLNTFVHMVFKSYGYRMAENPAYVSVVILTTSLWVLLYYKICKKQEIGDLKAGLMVVLFAGLMAAFCLL